MGQVRIINRLIDNQLTNGDYVLVDSQSEGTRKFDLGSYVSGTNTSIDNANTNINNLSDSVEEISDFIGSTEMETSASTITGAINEHEILLGELVNILATRFGNPETALSNANNATETGNYRIGSTTLNGPIANGSYALLVFKYSPQLCVQFAISPNSSLPDACLRCQTSSGWSPWYRITKTAIS